MHSQICSFTYGLVLSALELEGLLTKGSGETVSAFNSCRKSPITSVFTLELNTTAAQPLRYISQDRRTHLHAVP